METECPNCGHANIPIICPDHAACPKCPDCGYCDVCAEDVPLNLDIVGAALVSAEESGYEIHAVVVCSQCSQSQTRALRPMFGSVTGLCTGRRCDEKIT